MTVSCLAENSLGVVSRSLHVDSEYLPQRIMINTPALVTEGEEATVSCITSQSHPAPKVTWKLEKIGVKHEILEKVSDERTMVLGEAEDGEGGRLYRAGFVIEEGEELSQVEVSCRAVVEGLGEVNSDSMKIIVEKKPEEEVEFTTSGYEDIMHKELKPKEEAGITDLNTGELITVGNDEGDSVEDVTEAETTNTTAMGIGNEYYYEEDDEDENEEEEENVKEERSKNVLWIPFGEDQDISEYQDEFAPKYNMEREEVNEEEFYKPANLPEPQPNKDQKSSIMISPPSSVVVTGTASSTTSNPLVRIVLTVALQTFLALKYF